jgi:hypothetical protein
MCCIGCQKQILVDVLNRWNVFGKRCHPVGQRGPEKDYLWGVRQQGSPETETEDNHAQASSAGDSPPANETEPRRAQNVASVPGSDGPAWYQMNKIEDRQHEQLPRGRVSHKNSEGKMEWLTTEGMPSSDKLIATIGICSRPRPG